MALSSGQSVPTLRWGQAPTQRQVFISVPGFGLGHREGSFFIPLFGRGGRGHLHPSLGVIKDLAQAL